MLGNIAGVFAFLIIICLIVSFHELGHFSVARLFRTRIERFSVGFGKILLRKVDRNGVEWCLSAIPLGGYVKFAGDENISSMMPSREDLEASRIAITGREGAGAVKDYFHFKPMWQRFLIILAGPMANFVLAIFFFGVINLIVGDPVGHPTIAQVKPGSAAEAGGLKVGDVFVKIDGQQINNSGDVMAIVSQRANTPIRIEVDRAGQIVGMTVTPTRGKLDTGVLKQDIKGGVIGIAMTEKLTYTPLNPLQALGKGAVQTWDGIETTLTYIGRIFTGKENGDQISGLLGMAKATGDVTASLVQEKMSPLEFAVNLAIRYMAMLASVSVAIGFVNLLPIPALDGGHLAFYLYQGVAGKPIPQGIQNAAFRIAIVLVIGLMLFALWNDLNHMGLSRYLGG